MSGGCLGFFFQAEDGIRDIGVTGVQTCALPICNNDFPRITLLCILDMLRLNSPNLSPYFSLNKFERI